MESKRWDVVIFDYGRVLSQAPTLAERQEFAALVGVSEPPFFQLYSDTRDEYDCGRHDCTQHWQRFADAAGVSISPQQLAREIKTSGVRTAILSNMPPDLLCDMRKSFDWLDEFEVQIWSCEHGVIKPDQAIYRLCLDALDCEPHRTLFFDDRPNNVEGARKTGMESHVFESVEQARAIVRAGLNYQ